MWCFSAIRDHLGKKMCFSIFFDIFTFWDLVLIIDWGSYPNQLRFPRVKEESLYFPPYMYIIFIVYETVFQSINQESNFWLIWFNLLIKNPIFLLICLAFEGIIMTMWWMIWKYQNNVLFTTVKKVLLDTRLWSFLIYNLWIGMSNLNLVELCG